MTHNPLLPNTVIHLPPQHRRSFTETAALIALPLAALFVVWRLVVAADASPQSAPQAPSPSTVIPVTTPTPDERIVVALQTMAAASVPTVKPTYAPLPTAKAADDLCVDGITKPGETCTMPDNPPPLPTAYPYCPVDPGDRCRWPDGVEGWWE